MIIYECFSGSTHHLLFSSDGNIIRRIFVSFVFVRHCFRFTVMIIMKCVCFYHIWALTDSCRWLVLRSTLVIFPAESRCASRCRLLFFLLFLHFPFVKLFRYCLFCSGLHVMPFYRRLNVSNIPADWWTTSFWSMCILTVIFWLFAL